MLARRDDCPCRGSLVDERAQKSATPLLSVTDTKSTRFDLRIAYGLTSFLLFVTERASFASNLPGREGKSPEPREVNEVRAAILQTCTDERSAYSSAGRHAPKYQVFLCGVRAFGAAREAVMGAHHPARRLTGDGCQGGRAFTELWGKAMGRRRGPSSSSVALEAGTSSAVHAVVLLAQPIGADV